MDTLFILDEDKEWARKRIAELEAAILALGPEFYDAFNQTSETWHDNAPFEIVRDRQTVLDTERQHLNGILKRSSVSVPRQKRGQVGIGSVVTMQNEKGQIKHFKIAGDWTPDASKVIDGAMVVSQKAPIAQALLGKKVGETTRFGEIQEISYA